MKKFKVVLTTQKRIVTKYFECKEEDLKALIKKTMEEDELGALKYPPKILEYKHAGKSAGIPRPNVVPKPPKRD